MKTCKHYCGVTCVNGYCPNARDEYETRQIKIDCDECGYNIGCEDCYFCRDEKCAIENPELLEE